MVAGRNLITDFTLHTQSNNFCRTWQICTF